MAILQSLWCEENRSRQLLHNGCMEFFGRGIRRDRTLIVAPYTLPEKMTYRQEDKSYRAQSLQHAVT